jgi:hypothetical protein
MLTWKNILTFADQGNSTLDRTMFHYVTLK